MWSCRFCTYIVLVVSALVFMTGRAQAYLDPGTGSYIFQALAAGFFVIVVAFTTLKDKLIGVLRKLFKKKKDKA